MATAIGVAATAIVLTGSDRSGLPIFETERSDASALKTNPTLTAADANFDEGHRFVTPDGAGWVLTSRDGRTVCVTLPNRSAPESYGVACGPRADVERRGLAIELVGDRSIDPEAMNRVAFVLPAGASSVMLNSNRRTVPLQTKSGVAVAWLTSASTLTFRQAGRLERRAFQGAFEGTWYLCNGRKIALKPKPGPNPTIQCP
jgi:hypothetical protein